MKKYLGEEFLNKIYKDLHNSEMVMHSAQKSDNKNEKVERYLYRLESVTNKAFDINRKSYKNDIDYLKELYYKKYVIKKEDVPESYFDLQEKILKERGMGNLYYTEKLKQDEIEIIIKEQKETLDSWIEYLASSDTEMYPTWFKYYSFQGMLKLGSYDKAKGEYNKRTKHTIKPFIEINREALAMVYDSLCNFLQKEEINDIELEILLESGNFGKLYSYFVRKLDEINKDNSKSDDGIWKKYNKGSNPEILYNDIHGKGTGWCTAGGLETAKTHIEGGDFYVYYTKDKEGNYTQPRIAIRKENNRIAEIRGIADKQNLESNMEKVVEEKLKEADFPDRESYKRKVNDMQMMTCIYEKNENKVELTQEELRFLYEIDDEIIGFGFRKDPRIKEIIDSRNNSGERRKDISVIFGWEEDKISITKEEALSGNNIYHYGDLYLDYLYNDKELTFPQYIKGILDLGGLSNAKNLVLPKYISGYLNLKSLKNVEGLILPEYIGGSLYLSSLTNVNDFVFSGDIDCDLNMENLIEAQSLVFPHHVGKNLNLRNLTNAKDLVFPQYVGCSLILKRLESIEGLVFPQYIGKDLYLNSLKSTEGLILPEIIEGDLYLNSLSIYDKFVLPAKVNGIINFKDMILKFEEIPINDDGTINVELLLQNTKNKVR